MREKPRVQLSGEDGNAFAILGRCIKTFRLAEVSQETTDEFKKEAMSGDYEHLLQTVMKYFEVG